MEYKEYIVNEGNPQQCTVYTCLLDTAKELVFPRLKMAKGVRKTSQQLADLPWIPLSSNQLVINGGLFHLTENLNDIRPIGGTLVNNERFNDPIEEDYNYDGVLDLVWYKDTNKLMIEQYHTGLLSNDNIGFIRSGGHNLVINGVPTDETTHGGVAEYYNKRDKRTMVGILNDNPSDTRVLVAVADRPGLTGPEMSKFMLDRGCTLATNLDGDGSSYFKIKDEVKVDSSREVTDALVFSTLLPDSFVLVDGIKVSIDETAQRSRMASSSRYLLSSPVNGNIVTTLPNSTAFTISELSSKKSSDGYRWGKGTYNGKIGYFQFDQSVMNLFEKQDNSRFKVILEGTDAYLRETVRGEIVTLIKKGSSIPVKEFMNQRASDGYFWCSTIHKGKTVFFQYDPQFMYPTTDMVLEPSEPNTKGIKMVVTKDGANLRTSRVTGTVLSTAQVGDMIEVLELDEEISTDGYRWGKGTFGGKTGYFQYDPVNMHPIGLPTDGRYKMVLTGSAARIRSTVGGTILTTVSNGSQIQILEFLTQKHSDGYYWCRGTYGSTTGYFQYDPAVMYPTND